MSLKNKIAGILFLVGVGIAVLTLFSENETGLDQNTHLDQQNHPFAPEMISNYIKLDESYDALALFVVADEFCTSCINEIIEYIDAISNYIKSPINRFKTLRYAFIVGEDSLDYKQINYLLKFPFSSSLVQKDAPVAQKLRQWKQDISEMNQIVLIDLRRNEVAGRIGIFASSTTPVYKKNLVQEAFYELEIQDKLNK